MAAVHSPRMSRNARPGILVSPLTGEARIAGTGLEVFEVVRRYQALDNDFAALQQAYHWLTRNQLRAALEYYGEHRAEVDARLAREQTARIEDLWAKHPHTRPPSR
jgi:uncharacterized protein (DUF433 family)